MHAVVTRRTMNAARQQETMERARSELVPKLQQAPGFKSLTVIQGEDGIVTVAVLFESKAQAQAFQGDAAGWARTLDELGHRLESQNAGDSARKVVSMQHEQVMEILNRPLAQELLNSNIPARLAYTGRDGSPRVVPIAFHWSGEQFVVCTPPNAAKVPALEADPRVALTIDTNTFPPRVLLVRGTASVEVVEGVPSEYLEASRKFVGAEQFPAFEEQVRGLYKQMARIRIEPEWAKLLDFETTLPSAVEELLQ
jgi:heme-degrading monooxygenase HmoA